MEKAALAGEDTQPATGNLLVTPRLDPFRQGAHDYMQVVGHDGVGMDLDREDLGELAEPLTDPLPSMLEIFPGVAVIPAEEGAPYATGDTVENPALMGINKSAASSSHSGMAIN
jgi:hypothetical protein